MEPTPEQYTQLTKASELELLKSPEWLPTSKGATDPKFQPAEAGKSLCSSWPGDVEPCADRDMQLGLET